MSLPKVNAPEYTLELPSTDEEILYRPFLVKEEKLLLIAQETGDETSVINAVKNIVQACILNETIDVSTMALFDLEYIFLNLRAKSIGETAQLKVKCPDDEKTMVDVEVFLPDVKVVVGEGHTNKIELTKDMLLEMTYPRFDLVTQMKKLYGDLTDIEMSFHMMADCMAVLYHGDEEYDMMDHSHQEKLDFLDGLTQDQFMKMQQFFDTSPKLSHEIEIQNPKTKKKSKLKLEGMQAFF